MDTTTFIFVLIGVATAAWPFKVIDLIERRPRHEKR